MDFTGYLNFLEQYEHDFVRLWVWEQAAWINESTAKITFDPLPYQRKGPGTAVDGGRKFDLTRFNQAYFDRLRSRVIEAGERGIYVSVMLFQGFSNQRKNTAGGNPWTGHPFNVSNNVNGINGDPSGNNNGSLLGSSRDYFPQEAYVRKAVDTLNDLDNVLYEISGGSPGKTAIDSSGAISSTGGAVAANYVEGAMSGDVIGRGRFLNGGTSTLAFVNPAANDFWSRRAHR